MLYKAKELEGTFHIRKCSFGHFKELVRIVGYDKFVGRIGYTGGINNEIFI